VGAILVADWDEANLGAILSEALNSQDGNKTRSGRYLSGTAGRSAGGSAAAARVMMDLFAEPKPAKGPAALTAWTVQLESACSSANATGRSPAP